MLMNIMVDSINSVNLSDWIVWLVLSVHIGLGSRRKVQVVIQFVFPLKISLLIIFKRVIYFVKNLRNFKRN